MLSESLPVAESFGTTSLSQPCAEAIYHEHVKMFVHRARLFSNVERWTDMSAPPSHHGSVWWKSRSCSLDGPVKQDLPCIHIGCEWRPKILVLKLPEGLLNFLICTLRHTRPRERYAAVEVLRSISLVRMTAGGARPAASQRAYHSLIALTTHRGSLLPDPIHCIKACSPCGGDDSLFSSALPLLSSTISMLDQPAK